LNYGVVVVAEPVTLVVTVVRLPLVALAETMLLKVLLLHQVASTQFVLAEVGHVIGHIRVWPQTGVLVGSRVTI
jgi:hypothetical protein